MIMVDSDNGSIIQEIMLSIAQEYNLAGVEPKTRIVKEQSASQLQRYTGKYNIPQMGDANISIKNTGLELSANFLDVPIFLLPETDSTFFDETDGEYFNFLLEGELITGFKVQQFEALKIE